MRPMPHAFPCAPWRSRWASRGVFLELLMGVCMCVCIHVVWYVCIHTLDMYTYIPAYVHTYIPKYIHTYRPPSVRHAAFMYSYTCRLMQVGHCFVYTSICICICLYVDGTGFLAKIHATQGLHWSAPMSSGSSLKILVSNSLLPSPKC